jgi:hypothetical protein
MTSDKTRVIWEPQPGSQTLFLSCPYYEVLYEGTRGNGKTDSLLMDFAQHCGQGYGANWRGVLFRQTYPQLADVVAKSKKWFFQIFPRARFNAAEYKWSWPGGEELLLRHMKNPDDYWNYHGHEYPWIGWEELTNWPDLVCYDKMKACSRSSHPGMPRKYRSTCNPFGVGHGVVKMRFIDPAPACVPIRDHLGERIRIHGSVEENKKLLDADPEYIDKLEAIDDENLRKAWRYGEWDIVAGGMFTEVWDPSRHVVEPFNIPSTWRVDRSFDWGSSKPFAVCWWAESDGCEVVLKDGIKRNFPRGTVFLIAEWYGWSGKPNEGLKMLAVDIAKGIKEREKSLELSVRPGPADNSIFDTQDGNCIADNMAAQGVRWERADKSPGSRVNGWEIMRGKLSASRSFPMEEPGLFIFETCRQWLRTVPTLPRDEKKMDDVDCFVAGTLISTPSGHVPIEKINVGDLVNTPIGPRKVIKAGVSGKAPTLKVNFSNGKSLEGTLNHKIFVKRIGLLPLYLLSSDNEIGTEEELWWWQRSFTEGQFSGSTNTADIMSAALAMRAYLALASCKGWFGKRKTELSPMVCTSTIKTTTPATIVLKTWNLFIREIMHDTTTQKECCQVGISKQLLKIGEVATRGNRFFERTLRSAVTILPKENLRALIVANLLQLNTRHKFTVQKNVVQPFKTWAASIKYALFAGKNSQQKPTAPKQSGLVVTSVDGPSGSKTVYNLTVEQAHLFYANGILVTNTDAEDHLGDASRYRLSMAAKTVTTSDMFA